MPCSFFLPSFRHLKRYGNETSTNPDSESEQDKYKNQHQYRRCSRRLVHQQKIVTEKKQN